MNKKSLLITVIALVVVLVGGTLLYNNLVKKVEAPNTLTTPQVSASQEQETQEEPAKKVNPAALDFTVVDNEGNNVNLSDFYGTPIVVNFWASWCPPCKAEMPSFQKAYEQYGDGEVVFLMVSMTGGRESEETAKAFIEEEGYTFPVYHDIEESAATTYGVYSLPTSLFINKKGEVVAFQEGMLSEAMLAKGIALALEE